MSVFTDALVLGGTTRPTPETACFVSYWHLPGGWDCVNATARNVYFSDLNAANRLASEYEASPEMAFVQPYTPGT